MQRHQKLFAGSVLTLVIMSVLYCVEASRKRSIDIMDMEVCVETLRRNDYTPRDAVTACAIYGNAYNVCVNKQKIK